MPPNRPLISHPRLHRWRVLCALSLALGSVLTLLSLTGPQAVAAPETQVQFGSLDVTRTGTLTVHKHEWQAGEPVVASADGAATIPSEAIAGVQFTVWPLTDLPLGEAESWQSLDESPPSDVCAADAPNWEGHTFGPGMTAVTNDRGEAVFNGTGGAGIPVAAYLVCETGVPQLPANRVFLDRAQPFLATVPTVDPTSSGWRYSVHAYPKNAVASITKRVSTQQQLGLGAETAFPVTTDIPTLGPNTSFRFYAIRDSMPGLTDVRVTSVRFSGEDVPEQFYEVTVSSDGTALVSFTSAGLSWLASGDRPGGSLVTTFQGRLLSLGTGVLSNQAELLVDTLPGNTPPEHPDPTGPGTPSNGVESRWGQLLLSKVDEEDPDVGVQGAAFEVFAAEDPYPADGVCRSTPTGDPIQVRQPDGSQVSTFRSDAAGRVSIAGLFVSDSTTTGVGAEFRCYVVRETQAPAGFQQPTSPYTAVKVRTGTMPTAQVPVIQNRRLLVAGLPLTGATGRMALLLGGIGALLLGAGAWAVSRRRAARRPH